MCLAVPGKVMAITEGDHSGLRSAIIDFGGVSREVSLAFLPQAQVGQFVIVHVGVALSIVNEIEAQRIFDALKDIEVAEATIETPSLSLPEEMHPK